MPRTLLINQAGERWISKRVYILLLAFSKYVHIVSENINTIYKYHSQKMFTKKEKIYKKNLQIVIISNNKTRLMKLKK